MLCQVKKLQRVLLIFFVFAISFALFSIVRSETATEEIDKKQDQLEELEKKADSYRQIIDLKNKQQNTLQNQMQILDSQIGKLEKDIESNKQALGSIDAQIRSLERKIDEKSRIIDAQRAVLAGLIQVYYEEEKGDVSLAILGESAFSDVLSNSDRIMQTSTKMNEIIEAMKSLKKTLENEREQLGLRRREYDNAYYQLSERESYLESNKEEKERLAAQTRGEESRYKVLLSKVEEQQRAIQREIEDLEAERVGNVDLGALPPKRKGFFSYPVNPVEISQGYGVTSFSKRAYASGKHNGVDFAIDSGSAVYAASAGKILAVGNNGRYAYGKWVAIDHGNGLVTLYGHMNSQLVSKGETVKQGEKIGLSGNTGFSTGPHVHFSVFAKSTFELTESKIVRSLILPTGSSVNPMNYL